MRRHCFLLTVVLALLNAVPSARQRPQDVVLQAAVRAETVQGLKEAIRQYEMIVATYGQSDRALAAKALLRMAEAYTKLGAADARKVYERIVRDFADQKTEAATARERLGASRGSATGERVVWSGWSIPDEIAVSPDGRLIAYVDDATGNVGVRDVATGTLRTITSGGDWEKNEYAETPAFSRDGLHIAHAWHTSASGKRRRLLRTVAVTSGPQAQPRTIAEFEASRAFEVLDWTPDGRRILVQFYSTRSAELAFVTVDGTVQTLKPLGGQGVGRARVSPDGRYVAFDATAGPRTAQSDIFVIRADGAEERAVIAGPANEAVAGWSPDGGRLLFMVDAGGGTSHLMSQAIRDARTQGDPEVLRRRLIGDVIALTTAGTIFLWANTNDQTVLKATVDFNTGRLLQPAVTAVHSAWPQVRQPRWSADGRRLLTFSSSRASGPRQVILSIHGDTQTRFLPLPLTGIWTFSWSPDEKWILARATDLDGRHGIYRIDAQTGDAEPVLLNTPSVHPQTSEFRAASAPRAAYFMPQWTRDGKQFFYINAPGDGSGGTLRLHDAASGEERIVYEGRSLKTADGSAFAGMRDHVVSPDGRFVAGISLQPESVLWIATIADGTVREIFRVKRRNAIEANTLQWTPDSTKVVIGINPPEFGTRDYRGRGHELWAVGVADAKAVKLEIGLDTLAPGVAIHPDGRQIAFTTHARGTGEIRLIENVVPAAARPRTN